MPIEVIERSHSRVYESGGEESIRRKFLVRGTDDPIAAKDALGAAADTEFLGIPRKNYSVEESETGLDDWHGEVSYVLPNTTSETPDSILPPDGSSEFSFEITEENMKITQSLDTTASYAPTGLTAPDFGGAINVSKKGKETSVDGVDIGTPVHMFSEKHIRTGIDVAYKTLLARLVGKVNVTEFRGYAAGEVKFVGARGSQRGETKWEITYSFKQSPNRDDIVIGYVPEMIEKLGWEYLWVFYKDHEQTVDTGVKVLTKIPWFVYIEQVSEFEDFSLLALD